MNITHLTSAHPRLDTRIFIKMCSSLAKNQNYKVNLVVADGLGDEIRNGVSIFDVGSNQGGRLARMTKTVRQVYEKAKQLDSDIYHLHDPELIPIGLKLKKNSKKVIFDAHEDLPKQIMNKPYLNPVLRWLLSKTLSLYESYTCSKFDSIIAATPYIANKFLKINPKTINVNNFPILEEFANDVCWKDKQNEVVYVGIISEIRGIKEIISAIQYTKDIKLNLVGAFSEKKIENELKKLKIWVAKINELGFLNRQKVSRVLSKSKAGLVTFHSEPNHIEAQPNKMFEYMSAGLPIIASNFPLWREIVEGNQCGICVNPLEPKEIGRAMQYLIDNPIKAEQMGKNGRRAVEQKYNWAIEEKKLLKLYKSLEN